VTTPGASPAASAVTAAYPEPLRLVTLGDAYTFGTLTPGPSRDSWPAQLQQAMDQGAVRLSLVANLAEQGETSANVLDSQVTQVKSYDPDVVTLQVGVNDIIVRETAGYEANLGAIFDELLTVLPAERVFAITTPDHTLTLRGGDWSPREEGRAAVARINAILTEVAGARGITVVDISQVNRLAAADASLTIGDGPYPSAKQYAGWVEIIGPAMTRALLASQP
jgi:lysophospholipase L1-like esterase